MSRNPPSWEAGNSPNDRPEVKWLPDDKNPLVLHYSSRFNRVKPRVYDLVVGPVTVDFSLSCMATRWYPAMPDGTPGEAYSIFSCDTAGTRLIPPQPPTESLKVKAIDGTQCQQEPPKFDSDVPFYNPPYIGEIRIQMGFSDESVGAELKARIPEGDHAQGDISSSKSESLGLGFFGSDLTASLNYSWSNSCSMSLRDYAISSHSSASHTLHKISLAMLDGGNPYPDVAERNPGSKPFELKKYGGGVPKPDSTQKYKVPPMSTEDMDLNVSGFWKLPTVKKDLEFVVTVEVDFVLVAVPYYESGTGMSIPLSFFEHTPDGGHKWASMVGKRTAVFRRTVTVPASRLNSEQE